MLRFVTYVQKSVRYLLEYYKFSKSSSQSGGRFSVAWKDRYPCLNDNTGTSGFDRHYIYHPAWAARILSKVMPDHHVDISSTLHFSTLVSAFIPVTFCDYRPAKLELDNLSSERADLTKLPFETGSIRSLSCMHVVEHIGLGRYGDPIDADGDLKAISELKRVVAAGGDLLFVVPVGKPRIMYNAHRIYSYRQILNCFSDMQLLEFALIPDESDVGLIYNPDEAAIDSQSYGCGCFWFRKNLDGDCTDLNSFTAPLSR